MYSKYTSTSRTNTRSKSSGEHAASYRLEYASGSQGIVTLANILVYMAKAEITNIV